MVSPKVFVYLVPLCYSSAACLWFCVFQVWWVALLCVFEWILWVITGLLHDYGRLCLLGRFRWHCFCLHWLGVLSLLI